MAKKKTEAPPAAAAPAEKKAPAKTAAPAAAAKPAAPTAAKPAAAKTAAARPAAAPAIDTSAAANVAAAMIANKATGAGSAAQPPKKESSAFKQLKAGLNNPAGGGLGGAFAVPQKNKKTAQNYGGGKQVGRNQTFGADVNRTGVPRRTPG